MRHLLVVWPTALLAGVMISACREPTSIRLVLRTNVTESDQVSVAVFAGSPEDIESQGPVAVVRGTAWEAEQRIGSLTFVPQSGDGGALTLRVTLAEGRDATDCSFAHPEDCVFARRRLAFLPHKSLVVPVALFVQCEGIACTARTTCNAARACVPATVLPADCASDEGCVLEGDPPLDAFIPTPPSDAASNVPFDAANDASADASRDGSNDAASNPIDGGDDAGLDYSMTASVQCFAAGTCQGALPVCCHSAAASAICVARSTQCPGMLRVACDAIADCAAGRVCCRTAMTEVRCFDSIQCFGSHKLVCSPVSASVDCAIAGTTICTPRGYWSECGP